MKEHKSLAPASGGLMLEDAETAAAWVAARQDTGRTRGRHQRLFRSATRRTRALLYAARALGDALLVGLNSDSSVSKLKGPDRPLIAQDERAELLGALRWVDAVVIFPELTAEALLDALHPAIYAKGGDYYTRDDGPAEIDEHRLPEARVVRAYGGRVVLLPYVDGHSTTALVQHIKGQ